MSSKIAMFISYRRDDSAGHVGRLYDALSARYGSQQIFVDIDHIGPGEDFVRALDDAVGKSLVTLVVIGRRWIIDESGYSRLQNPNDFVRLEVVAALQKGIRVIPVLVQGAQMPGARELPWDLQDLSTRNAFELSDLRWKEDTARLTSELDRIIKDYFKSQPQPVKPPRAPTPRWVWWAFAALLLVTAAGYVRNRVVSGTTVAANQLPAQLDPTPPDAPQNVAYNAGSAKDDARRWRSDAELVWVDIQQSNIPDPHGARPFNVLYQFVSPRDGRLMSVIDAPTGRTYAPVNSPIQTAIYPIVLPFMDLPEALRIAKSNGLSGPIQRAYLYWRPLTGRPAVLVWTIYPYPQGPTPTQYNIDAQTGATVPQPELIN